MPYPGIPKSKWAKMDRCVDHVLNSKSFRQRYKAQIKKMGAKSLAIAICRKTLKV